MGPGPFVILGLGAVLGLAFSLVNSITAGHDHPSAGDVPLGVAVAMLWPVVMILHESATPRLVSPSAGPGVGACRPGVVPGGSARCLDTRWMSPDLSWPPAAAACLARARPGVEPGIFAEPTIGQLLGGGHIGADALRTPASPSGPSGRDGATDATWPALDVPPQCSIPDLQQVGGGSFQPHLSGRLSLAKPVRGSASVEAHGRQIRRLRRSPAIARSSARSLG
jgi:hypothetical protein